MLFKSNTPKMEKKIHNTNFITFRKMRSACFHIVSSLIFNFHSISPRRLQTVWTAKFRLISSSFYSLYGLELVEQAISMKLLVPIVKVNCQNTFFWQLVIWRARDYISGLILSGKLNNSKYSKRTVFLFSFFSRCVWGDKITQKKCMVGAYDNK